MTTEVMAAGGNGAGAGAARGTGPVSRPRVRRGGGRVRRGYLYRRPKSPFWWMAVGHRGRLRRASTGTRDRKRAKAILDAEVRRLNAADAGYTVVPGPEAERTTVGDLLDRLDRDFELRGVRSLGSVRSHLVPVREWFGALRAVDVTAEAIDEFVAARRANEVAPVPRRAARRGRQTRGKRTLSNATINRGLQLLGQALRGFLVQHQRPMPAIRRLPERNVRQGFFEKGEVEAVLAALPEHLRDVVRFAFLTGWRKGEVVGLRWADVDREGRVVRLAPERSKTGDGRVLTLDGPLADLVARRWRARVLPASGDRPGAEVAEFVFHRDGAPVGDFDKAWRSACAAAGCPGKLFHDLRRSAIRNMVRAGVPERVAMAVSGHRTRAVFDRYNIVSERDLREAMAKTGAYLDGLPSERRVLPLVRADGGAP